MTGNLPRILLAEDNNNDLELTMAALRSHHVANEVDVARDGAEALDYLYRRGPFANRQPGPLARNRSRTSRDNRTVVRSFVGAFCGPRRRMRSFSWSDRGRTSAAGRKCLKSSKVSSRTSPSLPINGFRLAILPRLSRICPPEADDPEAGLGFREAQHV